MTEDLRTTSFIARFNKGFARPNRYRVEFAMPRGVSGVKIDAINSDSMSGNIQTVDRRMNANGNIGVFCHTCNLPQRTLLTYEHKQHGAPYRVPYSQQYDPVTFSFYTDPSYTTRQYFDIWQAAVVNLDSNTFNYYDEFTSDVHIMTLDNTGNFSYMVTLYEAYPLNVGMVDLSYSNMNSTQTITVTMSYKYWKTDTNDSRLNRTYDYAENEGR